MTLLALRENSKFNVDIETTDTPSFQFFSLVKDGLVSEI